MIYLSGPIRGIPEGNAPAFKAARELLRSNGLVIVCPSELGEIPGGEYYDYLKRDIKYLVDCQGVAFLDGWENSKGANLEIYIAIELELDIRYYRDWI